MAGEEEEAVLVAPGQLADQVRDGHPARAHARRHAHAQRAARPAARAAVSPSAPRIDRQGVAGIRHAVSGPGVPQIVVTIMLCRWSMRTWMLPEHARLLRRPRLARRGQPADQRDLAGRARREVLRPPVADVDDLGLQPLDRGREGVREPRDDRAVGQGEPRLLGQADERLDLPPLDLDAVATSACARCSRRPAPRPGCRTRARARRSCGRAPSACAAETLGGQLGLERIAILPGRRHGITSSRRCRMMRRTPEGVNAPAGTAHSSTWASSAYSPGKLTGASPSILGN